MNSNDFQFALQQLSELQSFAYLESNLVNPPFTVPQDRLGASGVVSELWVRTRNRRRLVGDGCFCRQR